MASVVTTEFVRNIHEDSPPFSVIEQQSLLSRLIQELEAAIGQFLIDPRGFIRDVFSADTKDAKRRQRIHLGLVCALVVHVALIVLIAVVGLRAAYVPLPIEQPEYRVTLVEPAPRSIEEPTNENTVSSKPDIPKGNGGGGGGGQETPQPPSKGVPPPMVPRPQLVSMNPSTIPEPSLPVSPTIVGPLSAPPPPGPTGDPGGKSGDFSGGPGSGGGIGRGEGPGVGGGKDAGTGPGGRGGRGGGVAGSPDGSLTPTVVDFNQVKAYAGYRPWTWIHKERAIITPEARENKIIGTVVLRANFNADGTITDIEVAMRVDFMTESAIESLRRCTFRPATIDGRPITVRRVPIRIDVHY